MPRRPSTSPSRSPIVPKPTISSPPPQQQGPTPTPTLGQSIKDGFGFGLGSAIAHRIIGPAPVVVQHQQVPVPTTTLSQTSGQPEYDRCMKESFNNAELCKEYLASKT